MPIAWRTDYAMRIMYEAARLGPGGQASINVIAKSAMVPYDFARQIANRLAHEGLLVSTRGARGGFSLARPADRISMLDVFNAMNEKPSLSLCHEQDAVCRRSESCPMHHGLWTPIDNMIERELGAMTLARAIELGDGFANAATPAPSEPADDAPSR